jgi:hypothetical protein
MGIDFFLRPGLSSRLFASGSPAFDDTAVNASMLFVRRFLELRNSDFKVFVPTPQERRKLPCELSGLKDHDVEEIASVWTSVRNDHGQHDRPQATSRQFAE